MNRSTIGKLSSAALVTGVATVALAAPASAVIYHPPVNQQPGPAVGSTTSDTGWQVAQVATGAAGGIVLTGAGVAVVIGVRRHHKHVAHPA